MVSKKFNNTKFYFQFTFFISYNGFKIFRKSKIFQVVSDPSHDKIGMRQKALDDEL